MRRLRYGVAMSLDGFIAGPNGEYDWIVIDPAIDFAAIFAQYDTLLMGRRTFEIASTRELSTGDLGHQWVVVSRTFSPPPHPNLTVIRGNVALEVAALKSQPGKDIWLFGGGVLFRSLLDAALVDSVEVTVIPVLLGSGVPLLPEGRRQRLHLETCKALPSGTLMLNYSVVAKQIEM